MDALTKAGFLPKKTLSSSLDLIELPQKCWDLNRKCSHFSAGVFVSSQRVHKMVVRVEAVHFIVLYIH